MTVLMFQPRFHDLIRSGAKTRTIRPPRKRPVKPDDPLSLRSWSGSPYRSKQVVLLEAVCLYTAAVQLHWNSFDGLCVWLNDIPLEPSVVAEFVRSDGFMNEGELAAWYHVNGRAFPFEGVLIRWAP